MRTLPRTAGLTKKIAPVIRAVCGTTIPESVLTTVRVTCVQFSSIPALLEVCTDS